jgi:ABC-2 type transport system ATP-binding protein
MIDPVICLGGLSKNFGHTIAVDGISMGIGKGEIFGFLGANGAGKTTTIRMLCGLTRPTRGHGVIHGLDIWRQRSRVRWQFGYVPQRFSLYADLTVLQNMRFFGRAYRVSKHRLRTRIDRLLSELDLAANQDTKAGSLSGGFKQLLSISCALIHEPSVLLPDEPTAGLDPVHRQFIWAILYDLKRQGTTIFLTTHYMDEAERCTDIGLIQGGQLIAKGSPLTLKERLHCKLLEVQVADIKDGMRILRGLPDVYGVALRSGRLRIWARDPEALLYGWLNRWPHENLRCLGYSWVEPDMEDVFMAHSQRYFSENGLRKQNNIYRCAIDDVIVIKLSDRCNLEQCTISQGDDPFDVDSLTD